MNNTNHTEHRVGNVIILTAGILTSAIGLLAMLGWIFQLPQLASWGANIIPMAPSTAFLSILTGIALSLRNRLPQNRGTYFVGLSIGLLVAVTGLLLFILSLTGIHLNIEQLGFSIPDTRFGIQVGHMSLITAVSFVTSALAFLLTLWQPVGWSKRAWIALALAFILVLSWSFFLFVYLFLTPLMYHGVFRPPSLPTCVAFLFFAIGLFFSAGLQLWPYTRIKYADAKQVSCVLLLIFILLTASILIGAYFDYRNYEKNFRNKVEQQLSAIAELKVSQLSQWRKERLGDASIFYKNHVFSDLVKRYFKNQSDEDAKNKIQAWIEQIAAAFNYDRICLQDIAGTEHISFPPTKIHPPGLFLVNSAEALKSGNVKFQDFYRDENDKKVYLTIFVPILDECDKKKPLGIVTLRIDPTQYLYPLIEKWPTPSKTSETLIIRRDGNDALFLNNLRFNKDAALNLRSPITNEKMPAVKAALGQTGIVEGIDYRGVPVIADIREVPDSPWFIVARMDMKEVYAPLRERMWMMFIFIVILIIGAGGSVGFVWQQQHNRFYREQYKLAEVLKINQRMLDEAERLGKVGGWEFDIDTKIQTWTEEVYRIHEVDNAFKPTVEMGINFYAPASRPVIEQAVQRAIEHGEPFDVELEIITAKNNLRWVHVIGNIDQKRRKVFGFFQDITERKRAEEKTLTSEVKFRTVAELSPLAIYASSGSDQKGIYINEAFYKIFGFTMEDVPTVGIWWIKAFPDEKYRQQVIDQWTYNIEQANKNNTDVEVLECTCTCKDGSNKIIGWVGKTIGDEFWAYGYDFTDKKKAEENLLKSQAELRKTLEISNKSRQTLLSVLEDQQEAEKELQKLNSELEQRVNERTAQLQAVNKELETFTYSVSHDLKAPLRGIDGYSKLLLDLYKPSLNEEAQTFVETIRNSTLQMNQLIDDLLNYSRLERSQLNTERIKIKDLIKSVLSIYNSDMEAGNFIVNMNMADIELIADPKGLTIALRNLVENAIKFTRGKANPLIQIGVEEKDLSWIISVNDNGIGFDMKYSQKIFEIFQRLQRVEDYPGTGIGLAMVGKAMQRMHGRAWAESTPGMGSTFYLEIPKNQ